MKNVLKIIAVSVMLIFLISGCAPKQELNQAKELIESVKVIEGDRYLSAEFTALNDSLNLAMQEIDAKHYKNAKKLLKEIIVNADTLKIQVPAKKEEVRNQAEAYLSGTQSLIEEVKVLIEEAPTGKEGKIALEEITFELIQIETSLVEIPVIIQNGDYLTAFEKVKVYNEKALQLKTELENVVNKVK